MDTLRTSVGERVDPPRRRRALLGPVLFLVGLLVVVAVAAVAWLVIRGQGAARQLLVARDALSDTRDALADGRVEDARAGLGQAQQATNRASDLTSDPVFSVASSVPVLGRTPNAVRTVAETMDDLMHGAFQGLVETVTVLDPSRLRIAGNGIDVDAVARAAPALRNATAGLQAATENVAALNLSATPASVHDAVTELLAQLRATTDATASAATAAQLVPPMLGSDGPRRYFLALQSNNEARGTGGFLGAYGILTADDGEVNVDRLAPRSTLDSLTYTSLPLGFGRDYRDLYGDQPASWASANISPHYPYAARLWQRMYRDMTGTTVDGVITVDPVTLSYLLEVTGPVTLADGRTVTGDNVVALTENRVYSIIRRDAERDRFLQQVAQAAFAKVLSGAGSPDDLFSALGQAAVERRMLVWSDRPREEALLAATSLGGVIPDGPRPFAGVALINGAGNKLDYYLQTSLTYQLLGCTDDGARDTQITVQLHNSVRPGAKLPLYVDQRLDLGLNQAGRARSGHGDQFLYAQVYATDGSRPTRVTLDGKPVDASVGRERGKTVVRVGVSVPARSTVTLQVEFREPPVPDGVSAVPQTFATPLVKPASIRADAQVCALA